MKWKSVVTIVPVVFAIGLGGNAQAAFDQCPAIGLSASCAVLVTINPNGSLSFQTDSSIPPYDGVEDTLVGVVNKSGATVFGIALSGSDIFGLDGDGACTWAGAANCGPYGYEGPGTSFSIADVSNGTVNFTNGLADGDHLWFSLEGAPSQVKLAHTIVVDPGHGGPTCAAGRTGATGPNKALQKLATYPNTTMPYADQERNIALDIGLQLQSLFVANGDVVTMTRTTTGECPTVGERAQLANDAHSNIFISVHLDGSPSPSANGSTLWFEGSSSQQLGALIVPDLSGAVGTNNNGVKESGVVAPWNGRYITVLHDTEMAAVLAEVAFLSNASDETIMSNAASIGAAASGIFAGAEAFFNQ